MVRASALIPLLTLVACGAEKDDSGFQRQSALDHIKIVELEARIDALNQRDDQLEKGISRATKLAMTTYDAHENLRRTFNGNVDQSNDEARRERTIRGVCGQEQVFSKDGTYVMRNKDCPLPKRR